MTYPAPEFDQVAQELRLAQKLLLTTHENPDGDALGSLLGMHGVLEQLGKDVVMYMSPEEFPLPGEYRHLNLEEVVGVAPEDTRERVVVFLDCGNIDRGPGASLRGEGARILNVDHHHDNTHFGTVNLVAPDASCTAEIVFELARELGAEMTPEVAEALYVGLVTDTGKFMYENTTAAAHRMAGELIEAGVDPQLAYRRLFENWPFRRLQLLSRAVQSVARYDDGALNVAMLTCTDFEETGALENDSEGIVDHLRAVQGTRVAVLVRDLLSNERRGRRKVSLRSTDGLVDVSLIARELGGGGHRRAAGFSTGLGPDELVESLREQVAAQLGD